jgi:DNA polymerase elongation subunit (family B)
MSTMATTSTHVCKLFDFVVNESDNFQIQMFGIDEHRNTYSVTVNDFNPFVYIKVGNKWTKTDCDEFVEYIKKEIPHSNILKYELIQKKSLYGFDGGKKYNFLFISCKNMFFIHKLKSLYYDKETQKVTEGLLFKSTYTKIYECQIPPLLRFFHIQNISPSGWVQIEKYTTVKQKQTTCIHELNASFRAITALEKDVLVPYKICSFDIEANSSHGDFPESIKNYKKVAYDIIYYLLDSTQDTASLLKELLYNVFDFKASLSIDRCYLKEDYEETQFEEDYKKLIQTVIKHDEKVEHNLKNYFDEEEEEGFKKSKVVPPDLIQMITSDLEMPLKVAHLIVLMDECFPSLMGDEVTFIGSTFVNYGEEKPYLQHCVCLQKTSQILEDQVIESYSTEKEVLCAWTKIIQKEDPDIIIGYNIFGFDFKFMYERAKENDCLTEFMRLGRNKIYGTELQETSIILASGPYELKFIPMIGRLEIDVYTYMRKEFTLESYKLDFVSSYLLGDKIKSFENQGDKCVIQSKNNKGLAPGSYVHFEIINHSTDPYEDNKKFRVCEVRKDGFIIEGNIDCKDKMRWGLAKDDVSPQQIFEMTKQGPDERGIIAKYCIQDCNLVHEIFQKIDIITTYSEMSKLCSVPMDFLMKRGQGIKLTSYVAKKCREKDTLMPLISKGAEDDMYEGAIVLEPKCGLYLDNPVACLDYSSLYPSCSISENISMDSKVWTIEYNLDGTIKKNKHGQMITGARDASGKFMYDNLPGYKYVDIQYDTFSWVRATPTSAPTKKVTGYKVCRWAQFPDDQKGVLPSILKECLAARKATRKQMEKETDPFKRNILDKRQLSIKVTANSIYGQAGSKTSTFYDMDVAASITAMGRTLIIYAKEIIENVYRDLVVDTKYGKLRTRAEYIYGDTDSVFFTFNFKPEEGQTLLPEQALDATITLAKEAGQLATKFLKQPHDLEYEKTFLPFCLLSKKRYVGMLYEDDPNDCYRKSMGIVLKRRDNAPIVKDIYGGIIDILMKDKDIDKSIVFLKQMMAQLVEEKVPTEKLIISKSLRSFYKNPKQIAHNVLAERIGVRDPGNKPAPGDRIPYIYIQTQGKKLQGEKIETPSFIKSNKIKIDYGHYITNQIMNPVVQIYSLVLFDMKEFKRRKISFKQELETLRESMEESKYQKKAQDLKDKEVEKILFEPYLMIERNKKNQNTMITSFFKK